MRMLLTDLFEDRVARHPNRIAVDVPPTDERPERHSVTYGELAAMARWVRGQVADRSRQDAFVVVLLPRHTPWLFAAQLGVLSAGAAHICLDEVFPDQHLRHVVQDARAVAVVTDAVGARRFPGLDVPVVCVPEPSERVAPTAAADTAAPAWRSARNLAYAIYTSGTTGLPKGVLIEHRGVVNLIEQGIARFGLSPGDRIAQGSSPAYDSSVEETWLALGSGATLVVLDDATIRLGPDLVPWLRRERVTVLCPPPTLLRAMACTDPAAELPALRLCYVGGEPLPADIAVRWGGALWLENGYGPTECTVTVVRGRVSSGDVTIGRPVPPHQAHLLDEHLQPVSDGTPGELCIAGPGVARGYLGLDELTAQRFPTLPGIGRVYRTGDLVVRDAGGELRYLGRIDAQVKLRGYRIELEAIEAVLAACPGVQEVVCAVQGEEPERLLAAFVVPSDSAAPPRFEELALAVRRQLPDYMVPARMAQLERVPRTIGGKVDRRALPTAMVVASHAASAGVADDDTVPARVRQGFAAVLGLPAAGFGADDDFFALGGDSLRAALLVTRLRQQERLPDITVRDVYSNPTVARLAQALTERIAAATLAPSGDDAGATRDERAASLTIAAFTAAQVAFLLAMLSLTGGAAYVLGFVVMPWLLGTMPLATLVLAAPWLAMAMAILGGLLSFWLALAAKELLIGRYQPMRVSAWSGLRLRHWIVTSLARLVPWSSIAGTELQSVALRALGARVGRRVHIHRGVELFGGGWDLLELGDEATIGREVDLGLCELDEGDLVVGPVRIGRGATLETRAGTAPHVVVGAGAIVRPLSFVPSGTDIPAGEQWAGVPAAAQGPAPGPAPLDDGARDGSSWRYTAIVLAARLLVQPLLALPFAGLAWALLHAFAVDGEVVSRWLCTDGPGSALGGFVALVAFPVLALPLSLVGKALWLRILPQVPAGTHGRWSLRYAWLSTRTAWLEDAGTWLSGTLFWPWWLRLAGMRIGRDVEVSTILDVLPEHVAIGSGSFLADGVYLGVPKVHQGRVTVADTRLGAGTFVGNHVVVEAGQQLPDELLLGVSTVADAATMQAGTAWFGQPAFRLPRREVVAVDRALTHEPGPLRYTNRLFWEALRMLLPAFPAALALLWFDVVATASSAGLGPALGMSGLAGLAAAGALAFAVLLAKWLLLGRVRPGQHGLWSCWASRWDFHYVMWQRYGRALLQPLEGTLVLPWYLRAMGMRIGRRCVLGAGFAQVVDPDMITIEDGATVHALFQAHSFEDRVLKIDRVRLGSHATVGKAAVVLYGADIGEDAHVMPHSVVMKREALLPGRRYAGAPTAAAATSAPAKQQPERVGNHPEVAGSKAPSGDLPRDAALDAARGFAVLGMVWLHFVPEPAATDPGVLAWFVRTSLAWLEGVPAALFVFLAGAAFTVRKRDLRHVARRTAALLVVGLPFWRFVWPNDVLMPLALMLPITVAVCRAGRTALVYAIVLLTLLVPLTAAWSTEQTLADCLEDGTHLANHAWGMATVRYFLVNGAYPLLPWLCLPLLGALFTAALGSSERLSRWFWLVLPLPGIGYALHVLGGAGEVDLGGLEAHLAITWQPTSLPFLLTRGGAAVALTVGLTWWTLRFGLPRWLSSVAALGRASLTHYLVHIVVVYASLRWWWPDEDWSVAVGVAVAVGYAVAGLVGSLLWFARWPRGPLEGLLRWLSGPAVLGASRSSVGLDRDQQER